MNESETKDGTLHEIVDRLLHDIEDVIALIARPLAREIGEAARAIDPDAAADAAA